MINLVIKLPEEVVGKILGDWINVVDLARLDSAYCSNADRKLFTAISSGQHAVYNHLLDMDRLTEYSDMEGLRMDFYEWITNKGFIISRLYTLPYFEGLEERIKTHLLGTCGRHLTSIYFDSKRIETLTSIIRSCPQLEQLYVLDTYLDLSTGQELRALGHSCVNLQSLSLGHMKLSTAAYTAIATCFPQLSRLELEATDIVDSDLYTILEHSSKLVSLKLTSCNQLTLHDIPLEQPLQLRELHICNVFLINDASLSHIARLCPHLVIINVEFCQFITAVGMQALRDQCTELRCVQLIDLGEPYSGIVAAARKIFSADVLCIESFDNDDNEPD